MRWPGPKRTRKNRYKKRPRSGRAGAGARRLLTLAITLLGVTAYSLLLIVAYGLLTQSRYYRAKHLPVSGNQRLSANAIMTQAGLNPGVQILDLNLSVVHRRLLAHPWIAEARVAREIPDTLRVWVREHRPLAVMDMQLGRRYLLNAAGRLFKTWDATDPQDLPVVTGLAYRDLPVAQSGGSAPFQAVMALLTGTGAWEDLSLTRIEADAEIGLTLVVAGSDQRIRMGYGQYPQKLTRLTALKTRLKAGNHLHDFASIDVSDLERIVVAPKQTPASGNGDQQRSDQHRSALHSSDRYSS
ncbi:MAG: FtsQ-type POTRA domain-containing protein [Desulfosarcinaceae bacterium]|nr:FtsQ-type POTRA domain-containing protein [Desulfosarcinaceae bacterium]